MPLQTTFEILVAKGEIAHNEQFLHLTTIISALFTNKTIIYRDFLYFDLDNIKVACCRLIVCGKGLTLYIIQTHVDASATHTVCMVRYALFNNVSVIPRIFLGKLQVVLVYLS